VYVTWQAVDTELSLTGVSWQVLLENDPPATVGKVMPPAGGVGVPEAMSVTVAMHGVDCAIKS
jgi:hypothetical protein